MTDHTESRNPDTVLTSVLTSRVAEVRAFTDLLLAWQQDGLDPSGCAARWARLPRFWPTPLVVRQRIHEGFAIERARLAASRPRSSPG